MRLRQVCWARSDLAPYRVDAKAVLSGFLYGSDAFNGRSGVICDMSHDFEQETRLSVDLCQSHRGLVQRKGRVSR